MKAVQDFWEILYELDSKEKEKLLFFVTSLKRPPIIVKYFLDFLLKTKNLFFKAFLKLIF